MIYIKNAITTQIVTTDFCRDGHSYKVPGSCLLTLAIIPNLTLFLITNKNDRDVLFLITNKYDRDLLVFITNKYDGDLSLLTTNKCDGDL